MSRLRALARTLHGKRWRELRDVVSAQLALLHGQTLVWVRPIGEFLDARPDVPTTHRIPLVVADWETADRLGRAIQRATNYGVFSPKCLVRAVALSRMLEAHGIVGHTIRIGVRWRDEAFVAHAWVELAGRIIGDTVTNTSTFVPLTDVRLAGGKAFR